MNKTACFHRLIPFVAVVMVFVSCSKKVADRSTVYPALQPISLDLNAGAWKPILTKSPSAFPLAAPDALNSAAYLADLNHIKELQSNLSSDDMAIIQYWSAGAVLRWNEIMREMIARHNDPPYQNSDGTYSSPNQKNPFAYPQFPFSNPPFAARAFAYVSGAEYDALINAWYYKNLYKRAAPYVNDKGIKALIPVSNLPSYPSEDAVVEGAAVEVLKLMFPTEVDFITAKANQQRQYRMMAGANTYAELVAGESLGKQVADVFTARAKIDRAGAAGGNAAVVNNIVNMTLARNEDCWISLEVPKRLPMLPLFGKVLPFLFDTATVLALRPPPPYSTKSVDMKKETAEVLYYSKNTTREHERIISFWADGAGTYTPPGHWNAIACDEFVKEQWTEVRWARNLALLNMAQMDAAIVCWDAKFYYYNPRPPQMDITIKTGTGVPNFPSYTSGHSNFSGSASTVLNYLLPDRGTKFSDMAAQAAISRLYGAIHFRSDCEVGLKVGVKVGNFAVARAKADGADL